MKNISLSTVLLPILVLPVIMTYRLSPGITPYWLFGLIFGLLLLYIFIKESLTKNIVFWLIIILVVGASLVSAVIVRHQTAPIYGVHDIVLQLESALQFFLQGRNPYALTYFNTPLEAWHYSDTLVNPALFHFVMLPWYLIFSLPFYFLSISFLGFFDGRLPLAFLYFFILVLAWKIVRYKKEKTLFVSILALSPATFSYFLEGRSDFFMFAFLFWAWYLLERKRLKLAGIALALAFATKQSVWPIFPFYLIYLGFLSKSFKRTIVALIPFFSTFALIILPFIAWDTRALLNSTVYYLSGNIPNSYPIAGYGWGMVLNSLGVIKDLNSYYPFWIWQLLIAGPIGIILLYWLKKSPSIARLIFSYGVFLSVFWYFSRYFNNSHLGYLSTVFLTAYFWPRNEKN